MTDEEVSSVSGKYSFTVQNINRTEIAELNQEFFDKVFGPNVVDSEEAFKEKVKVILSENYNKEANVYNDEQVKEALIASTNIELPESFLKEWLLRANDGKVTEEQIEKEYPIYAKQLVWSLISHQISKTNEIKGEHEEVIEKTKDMIREQFSASGLGAQMEESMDMFVNNYLQGNEGQNYMQVMTSVQNDKVLKFAKEKIDLTEEVISIDKFKEILEN
jgi:trigger factor